MTAVPLKLLRDLYLNFVTFRIYTGRFPVLLLDLQKGLEPFIYRLMSVVLTIKTMKIIKEA